MACRAVTQNDDYSMKERTYRYLRGKPLYSFGYGLSYSTFAYSHLTLSSEKLTAGRDLTATVQIKNTSAVAGDDVAEAHLTPPASGNGGLFPRLQLVGFQRVHLTPGEARTVTFSLSPRWISEVKAKGDRSVQAGAYQLSVGGAQLGDLRAKSPALSAGFNIIGSKPLPR